MEKFNTKIPLRYGLIAFAFIVTLSMLMYVFYMTFVNHFMLYPAIILLALGFALFLAIWSGISYRRENGNVISFAHAFLAVYIVLACYSIGSTSSLLLINKVIDTSYSVKLSSAIKEKMSDSFEKNNMDESKTKEALASVGPEKFDPPLGDVFKGLAFWLAGFALISAIVAAFIKRGSGDLIATGETPATKIPTI